MVFQGLIASTTSSLYVVSVVICFLLFFFFEPLIMVGEKKEREWEGAFFFQLIVQLLVFIMKVITRVRINCFWFVGKNGLVLFFLGNMDIRFHYHY